MIGRSRALLVGGLVAVFSWAAISVGAEAADLAREYVIVDGPLAGTSFVADAGGKVSVKGERHGFVRPADADCPYLHFEGFEGGPGEKKIKVKESDCVRVNSTYYANEFLDQIAVALKFEEKGKIDQALDALRHSGEGLESAQKWGTVDAATSAAIAKHLKKARKLDKEAQDALKDKDKKRAEALLESAANHKHQAAQAAPLAVKLRLPPTLTPIQAVFDQASFTTTYTENLTPRPGSTVRYRWDFFELNDPSCVDFRPGTPAANQAQWYHPHPPCGDQSLNGSNGHQGVIGVLTYDNYYLCAAAYVGSNTGTGTAPSCRPPGPG